MSIPRDDYIGEPEYPSPWTTSTVREGLRDLDEAKIVSLAPDVCLTPVGSSVVPIPYPIMDYCGHDTGYTSSVRFTRKKAMVMRSRTKDVHGDRAGVRKGVKSGTVGDVSEPIGHASQVRAEGSHVIRHLDRFWMNDRNTQGEAIFTRGMQTYDAPVDDDPVPGSLQAVQGQPIQLAQAFNGTMTDAGSGNFSPQATAQGQRGSRAVTTVDAPSGKAGTLPKLTFPSAGRLLLRRAGVFGLIIEEEIRRASLTEEETRLEYLSGRIRMSNVGRYIVAADKLLAGQQKISNPLRLFQPSEWQGKYGFAVQPEEQVPLANDILSQVAGRQVDIREMSDAEVNSLLSPFQQLDEAEVELKLKELAEERRSAEVVAKNAEPDPESDPEKNKTPAQLKRPRGARIDRPRCYVLILQFSTPLRGTRTEMQRQLDLQQAVLNGKNPCRASGDIARYPINKPIGEAARPVERRRLINARAQQLRLINRNLPPAQALAQAQAWANGKDAIHTLDMIAGGQPTVFSGLGGRSENRSIGSQWKHGGKAAELALYAQNQCSNNCPRMQTQLIAA